MPTRTSSARWQGDLKSGSGTFRRAFNRYDPMPAHLADAARKDHATTAH